MKKSIFLFFAAILCAMTANAYNQAAKDLYFDNSEAKWEKCFVYIGKGDYTSCYDMTRVPGTQYLWQLPANFNGGSAWNGATGWVVCKEKWWASSQETIDKYIWHGDNNVTKKSTSAWVDTKIYKTNGAANATSDGTTKKVYTLTSYDKSFYTVTINTIEGGTLTVKDYDNTAVATGDSKIHLTVLKFSATPTSGYVLDAVEISDGTNTTTIAAADLATKTYTLTSAVTITPVWRATTSTVTVTATATNGTVTGGGVVEEGTSVTLTATADAGYQFKNWTVAGTEVSTANPYTFTANEDVTVTANFEETPKVTVYFVNNSGWTKIQAYAWGDKGSNASWAGVDITANKLSEQIGGFDVYSYTVEQDLYANVIFNNGSAQTKDYGWTDGNYYWNNEAKGFKGGTKADAESKFSVPVEYEYVYFINTNSWAAVNIYTWDSEIATWPGVAMNKEAEQIAGFDVYSHKEVKGTSFGGMKFNEGKDKAQTGDLKWEAGKYYAPSKGTWYDTKEAAAEALAAPVVDVYTVVGSSNELGLAWDPTKKANDMEKQDDGSYKKVYSNVELTTSVEWKIAKNGDWWNETPLENKAANGNSVLTISKSGIYNVTFTLSKDLKTAHAEAELLEETNTVADCFISGNAALTGGEGWKGNEFKMEYDDATETYSYTLTGLATDKAYELKIVLGGAWYSYANLSTVPTGVTKGNDDAIAFKIAEAGDVTVTYNVEAGITISGNFYVAPTYDYYIAGTLAGAWSATQQGMIKDDDVYKHTFSELAAGTYEFKITDGQWNNDGDATHEHTTLGAAYEEVSYNEGNIKIVTEEAINLTVIFNAATDKITFEGLTEKTINYVDIKFTITANSAPQIHYWADYITGTDWDNLPEMTPTANPNEYTFTIEGVDQEKGVNYLLKIGNLQTADQSTKTDVVADLKDLLLISIYGIDGWEAAKAIHLTIADDYATATANIELAAETTYAFKVNIGNKWLGNKSTMTSDNCTGWTFAEKDGEEDMPNAGITTTIAGEYTFTWNVADKKLSVTYPTLPTPEVIRTGLTEGQWGTLCPDQKVTDMQGASFYTLTYLEMKDGMPYKLFFDEITTNYLEAGKPYLFIAEGEKIKGVKSGEVVSIASNYNGFYGNVSGNTISLATTQTEYVADGDVVNYYGVINSRFTLLGDGTTVAHERAYVQIKNGQLDCPNPPASLPALAPGARRVVAGATGINTATGVDQVQGDNIPTKMIINGQLFILRGEKMYDAQGKLVK